MVCVFVDIRECTKWVVVMMMMKRIEIALVLAQMSCNWLKVRLHEILMNVLIDILARRSFDTHAVGVGGHWEMLVQRG